MNSPLGRKRWAIAEGYIPSWSNGPEPQFTSHETAGLSISAGEYSWNLFYSSGLIEAGAVDVLQADVTRCGGLTDLLRVDGLCKARSMPFSAHCAPQVHAHAGCAMETLIHCEYFHDHARIENMLFDGALQP